MLRGGNTLHVDVEYCTWSNTENVENNMAESEKILFQKKLCLEKNHWQVVLSSISVSNLSLMFSIREELCLYLDNSETAGDDRISGWYSR